MKTIEKVIYAGFATCALASASMPAFSWTWGVDDRPLELRDRDGSVLPITPDAYPADSASR